MGGAFLKRILIDISAIVCIVLCINFVIIQRNLDKPVYTNVWTKEYFDNLPENIVVANVGTSHGHFGFIYGQMDYQLCGGCANFALPSQSLVYDYLMLDYYKDNIAEGAIIFIPISYFSLYCEEFTFDFEALNNQYYDLLDYKHIERVNYKKYIMAKYLSFGYWTEDLIGNMFQGNVSGDGAQYTPEALTLEEIGERRAAAHYSMVNVVDGHAAMVEIKADSLNQIFMLCQEENWTPILLTMPYTEEYIKNMPESFLEDYYNDMNRISVQNGIRYWDYSKDADFVKHSELFVDSDHLNMEGGVKFTNAMIQRLFEEKLLAVEQ